MFRKAMFCIFLCTFMVLLSGAAGADMTLPAGLTEIGEQAFMNDLLLTGTLTIPAGVEVIGAEAFRGCDGVTELVLPKGLRRIESNAFSGCSALAGTVLIPYGCDVAEDAFDGCDGLTMEFVQPTPVECFSYTIIDNEVCITRFDRNCGIADVVIPDEIEGYPVTRIGGDAFNSCTGITSIILPDTLTKIDRVAFGWCTSLAYIKLPDGLLEIGDHAFASCASLEKIDLPDSITTLWGDVFEGCSKLKSINYPLGWTYYYPGGGSGSPFAGCEGITHVTIPEGTTLIPNSAFAECQNLISVDIPDSVTTIGVNAFGNCRSLVSADIPDAVKIIPDNAFQGCSSLTEVSLPDELLEVGTYAFGNCDSLERFYLPNSITTLGGGIFAGCDKLTEVNYPACFTNQPYWSPFSDSSIKTVIIPEGVTSIVSCAFDCCASLVSVRMPASLRKIGYAAFRYCSGLKTFVFPEGITDIGDSTFYGCTNLSYVYIPSGVTVMGHGEFDDCTSLKYLYIPESVERFEYAPFTSCPNVTVYGESGSFVESYALQNDIPFVAVSSPVIRTRLSGSVAVQSGGGIEGVLVSVEDLTESGDGSRYTRTDEHGGWVITGLALGHTYRVSYSSANYVFEGNDTSVFLSGEMELSATATLISSGESTAAVSAAVRESDIVVGSEAVFDLTMTDADQVRMLVDGVVREVYDVYRDTASVRRVFTLSGEREVVFQAGADGEWGGMSDPLKLTVTAQGTLEAPVPEVQSSGLLEEPVLLSWSAIPGAEQYTVYACYDSHELYRAVTTECSHQIPAGALSRAGQYTLLVMASGYGCDQSEGSASLLLREGMIRFETGADTVSAGSTVSGALVLPDGSTAAWTVTDPQGAVLTAGEVSDASRVTVSFEAALPGAYQISVRLTEPGSGDAYAHKTFTVTAYDWISAASDSHTFTAAEETASIAVTASGDWLIGDSPAWVTAVKTAAGLQLTAGSDAQDRTGVISLVCGDAACTIRVNGMVTQPYPAFVSPADGEVAAQTGLKLVWSSVEGAEDYLISLRDLTDDSLLISRESADQAAGYAVSAGLLRGGHRFRAAVGAVLAEEIRWTECEFTVSAEQSAVLGGVVRTTASRPVAGQAVVIMHGSTVIAQAKTDGAGCWRVDGLAPGESFRVIAYDGNLAVGSEAILLTEGENTCPDLIFTAEQQSYSGEPIYFDESASTQYIALEEAGTITIRQDGEWLSAKIAALEDASLQLTVAAADNDTDGDREAEIVMTTAAEVITWPVTQSCGVRELEDIPLAATYIGENYPFTRKTGLFGVRTSTWEYNGAALTQRTYSIGSDTEKGHLKIGSSMDAFCFYQVNAGYRRETKKAGCTITVHGNLELDATLKLAADTVITVTGDMKVKSGGRLDMTDGGTIIIAGDFVFDAAADHEGYLSAGEIRVGGSVTLKRSFRATAGHQFHLTASSGKQTVNMKKTGTPQCFANVYIDNQGFASLKTKGAFKAEGVLLSSYSKYQIKGEALLFSCSSLSRERLARAQMGVLRILSTNGVPFDDTYFNINMKLLIGNHEDTFSYITPQGNIGSFKVRLVDSMIASGGSGVLGGNVTIEYTENGVYIGRFQLVQNPDMISEQLRQAYAALGASGLEMLKKTASELPFSWFQDIVSFTLVNELTSRGYDHIKVLWDAYEMDSDIRDAMTALENGSY